MALLLSNYMDVYPYTINTFNSIRKKLNTKHLKFISYIPTCTFFILLRPFNEMSEMLSDVIFCINTYTNSISCFLTPPCSFPPHQR